MRTRKRLVRRAVVAPAAMLILGGLDTPAGAGQLDPTLIANDDEYTTQVDTPVALDVMANDEIGNFYNVTWLQVASPPAHGTVDPDVKTYTPAAGFVGDDTFEYELCGRRAASIRFSSGKSRRSGLGEQGCDTATVTIHVVGGGTTTTVTVAPATTVAPASAAAEATDPPTTVATAAAAELPRTGGSAKFLFLGLAIVVLGALPLALTRRARRG